MAFSQPLDTRSLHPVTKTKATAPSAPRLGDWIIERPLASGGQAETFRVHRQGDPFRRPFVAKVFRLVGPGGEAYGAEEQRWRLLREVTALRSLAEAGCPGIVPVMDHSAGSGASARPWYVMPYYAAGPMRQPYRDGEPPRFAEEYRGRICRVLEIAESLAATLAWMHTHEPRCVHRDLNASNVFFASAGGAPVLGDFGIAHLDSFAEKPGSAAAISGPWFWRPPELDRGDCYSAGPEADVFMLAGLIYESLSGGRYLPPNWEWGGGLPHELPNYSLRSHTADSRVDAVNELLRGMFAPEPADRMPAADVAAACREIRASKVRAWRLASAPE